ncbi:hypothetical protein [Leifsonia sp. fls2-241-R2A-40a]|uniref:hypothetical protein n=1 Tax=Leifsonia sp. fls2-241-R2A-40a TaxID=3040290 RepID=UPI002550E8B1|nr:hypothetical protein [Leifsonia sp. fls2-241-R2A-40a]
MMQRGAGAVGRALPALVIVLVAAGYVACLAGVAVSPALVAEPDRLLGVLRSAEHPWLEATVAHALYWLLVLVAASACVAAITFAGSAALHQLSEAERVLEDDLGHTTRSIDRGLL